jgi:hypothetical protein
MLYGEGFFLFQLTFGGIAINCTFIDTVFSEW